MLTVKRIVVGQVREVPGRMTGSGKGTGTRRTVDTGRLDGLNRPIKESEGAAARRAAKEARVGMARSMMSVGHPGTVVDTESPADSQDFEVYSTVPENPSATRDDLETVLDHLTEDGVWNEPEGVEVRKEVYSHPNMGIGVLTDVQLTGEPWAKLTAARNPGVGLYDTSALVTSALSDMSSPGGDFRYGDQGEHENLVHGLSRTMITSELSADRMGRVVDMLESGVVDDTQAGELTDAVLGNSMFDGAGDVDRAATEAVVIAAARDHECLEGAARRIAATSHNPRNLEELSGDMVFNRELASNPYSTTDTVNNSLWDSRYSLHSYGETEAICDVLSTTNDDQVIEDTYQNHILTASPSNSRTEYMQALMNNPNSPTFIRFYNLNVDEDGEVLDNALVGLPDWK